MTIEQDAPELIGIGAQAVVENANRLGLTWQLRPATVAEVELDGAIVAIYDGDTVPIGMINLNGSLTVGSRVMAMFVPPSGNFIIGAIRVDDLPAFIESSTDESFSNTTFDNGTAVLGIAFIAPASGAVHITVSAFITNVNNTFYTAMSYRITEGNVVDSGTEILAPSDDRSLSTSRAVTTGGATQLSASYRRLTTGLVPGGSYNVTAYKRVSGGTGSFLYRSLNVEAVR